MTTSSRHEVTRLLIRMTDGDDGALKAVELDEELAEAHEALGFVLLYDERDHEGAEGCFRRAITLDPANSSARRWHALNLSALGRHAEALAEIRRAGTPPRVRCHRHRRGQQRHERKARRPGLRARRVFVSLLRVISCEFVD